MSPAGAKASNSSSHGKNLVVSFDGTGLGLGEIDKPPSNVVYMLNNVTSDENQRVFYSSGIGTTSKTNTWEALDLQTSLMGLATGKGLLGRDIVEAYRFLMEEYDDGDRIYLFGFSRGAHAARVLAAILYSVGLLKPEQKNLAPLVVSIYSKAKLFDDGGSRKNEKGGPSRKNEKVIKEAQQRIKKADEFGNERESRNVTIHFMGCWDTVSSMIMPRQSWYWPLAVTMMPFTAQTNLGVKHFRHACAIDERRRNFRLEYWKRVDKYTGDVDEILRTERGKDVKEDCKQVWFVGCHGDVGGGWPKESNGLAQIALGWMLREAEVLGLRLAGNSSEIGKGKEYTETSGSLKLFEIHDSMRGFYPLLDIPPKLIRRRQFHVPRGGFSWICTTPVSVILTALGYSEIFTRLLTFGLAFLPHGLDPWVQFLWKLASVGLPLTVFVKSYRPEYHPKEPAKAEQHCIADKQNTLISTYQLVPSGIRLVLWAGLGYLLFRQSDGVCTKVNALVGQSTRSWSQAISSLMQTVPHMKQFSAWLRLLWDKLGLRLLFWPIFAVYFTTHPVYVPLGEPRPIPVEDELHPSVFRRLVNDKNYRPINLMTYLKEKYEKEKLDSTTLNDMTYEELMERVGYDESKW